MKIKISIVDTNISCYCDDIDGGQIPIVVSYCDDDCSNAIWTVGSPGKKTCKASVYVLCMAVIRCGCAGTVWQTGPGTPR